MLFPTYEFCFIFLPLTLFLYFYFGRFQGKYSLQHIFLLLASWFFYGYFNIAYLALLIGSNIFNYFTTKLMNYLYSQRRPFAERMVFISGIGANLLLIGYFKYYDFLIENINFAFHSHIPVHNILLPLGISFFIFQQILFLVECYKGKMPAGSFLDYLLFVSFFPQLIAGPIVTYTEIVPQLQKTENVHLNNNNLAKGLFLFLIGLLKKLLLADNLALIVNQGYALREYGICTAWVTAVSYTLQIYFDFSGYSDMARGLAYMFNIRLPINFDSPYQASSVQEFWSRWHITLGRTLKRCIYIPLGGSRNGPYVLVISTMITFFLSGLWHGAAWTFILWGTIYGILLVFERIFDWQRMPYILRRVTTILTINFLWVLFRSDNIPKALSIYRGMFSFTNFDLSNAARLANNFAVGQSLQLAFIIVLLLVCLFIVFIPSNSNDCETAFHCNIKTCVFCVVTILLSVISMTRGSNFIYFNF